MNTPDLSQLGMSQEEIERHLRYLEAVDAARAGDPQKYVEFQWPGVIFDIHQWDMIFAIASKELKSCYIKGAASAGKGVGAAVSAVLYYDCWNDARLRITSSSMEHAKQVMFDELVRFFKRATYRPKGEVLQESIRDSESHKIHLVNPMDEESFSGAHGEHTMFIFDEGTAVDDGRYKIAYTQAKKVLVLGNPRTLAGEFRDAFGKTEPDKTQTVFSQHGLRRLITVDGAECMNVRKKCLEKPVGPLGGIEINGHRYSEGDPIPDEDYEKAKPIIPGQMCYDKFVSMCADHDPFRVRVFARAKFPDEDPETQIFLPSWFSRHIDYWIACFRKFPDQGQPADRFSIGEPQAIQCPECGAKNLLKCPCSLDKLIPVNSFGLDVASSITGDESMLAAGGKFGCRGLFGKRYAKTSDTARWVMGIAEERFGVSLETGAFPVAVDVIGPGLGAADYMTDRGVQIIQVRGNAAAEVDPKQYANLRAEEYALTAKRLDPTGPFSEIPYATPPDAKLREELCSPEREMQGHDGFKFAITPKDNSNKKDVRSVKKRLGRSPDRADSYCYLWHAVRSTEEVGMLINQLDLGAWNPIPDNSWSLLGNDGMFG